MDRGARWATVHRVSKSQTLNQILGRLIRNPESLRGREWSGALEEGIEVLSSQEGEICQAGYIVVIMVQNHTLVPSLRENISLSKMSCFVV